MAGTKRSHLLAGRCSGSVALAVTHRPRDSLSVHLYGGRGQTPARNGLQAAPQRARAESALYNKGGRRCYAPQWLTCDMSIARIFTDLLSA